MIFPVRPAGRRLPFGAAVLAPVLAAALAGSVGGINPHGAVTAGRWDRAVVVPSGAAMPTGQVTAAVRRAGGHVLAALPLIDAVAATLPAGVALPATLTAVPDRALHVTAASDDGAGPTTTVRSALDLAPQGDEGAGVGVALIDTGVADVAGLSGRVFRHVDVTGGRPGDGYGHGTFLAGLIASTDPNLQGAAPGAHLLDVRVADADGSTSLVDVLRGLQAVATLGPRSDIRVVNLALSSGSELPYQLDPLTEALDALWQRGYVVVVPAGNTGPDAGSVGSPGIDPTLLTAGALDVGVTADRSDDAVPDWSGRGPTWQGDAKPDLVAPGVHLESLRAPDSVIDAQNPGSRVGTAYFRGSGTSMATAVTSAAAADVIAANPSLRPDDVKRLLTGTASPLGAAAQAAGAGGVDLPAALAAAPATPVGPGCLPEATAGGPAACRDADLPGDGDGWRAFADAVQRGDRVAAARAWSGLDPASRAWSSRAWSGLTPQTRAWAEQQWGDRAQQWSDAGTSAREWLARFWSSRAWSSRAWSSRAWSSRAWSSRAWSSRAWSAETWS